MAKNLGIGEESGMNYEYDFTSQDLTIVGKGEAMKMAIDVLENGCLKEPHLSHWKTKRLKR